MLTALLHIAPALENHLWQSTGVAAVAWLLAFALRKTQARTRYWIWFAASMKFLLPFSLLFAIGSYLRPVHLVVVAPAPVSVAVRQMAQPFSNYAPVSVFAAPVDAHDSNIPLALMLIWALGFLVVSASWWRRWRRVQKACGTAAPRSFLDRSVSLGCGHLDIPVKFSSSLIEPGIFGIFRPVLMLPAGIADRLTPAQMNAILAHEMSHIRRRDNLTAALHMVVAAVFWFHPIVWWIGARLVEERENACDEEVMRLGGEPETYAEGILEVCKFYTESPVMCVSGVSGADLKKRIVRIMSPRFAQKLTIGAKVLLASVAIAAIAVPLAYGAIAAPRNAVFKRVRMFYLREAAPAQGGQAPQNSVQDDDDKTLPSFEVASIKKHPPEGGRGMRVSMGGPDVSRFRASNVTAKMLIATAYRVKEFQISGGPDWINSERWDIDAKVDDALAHELQKLSRQQQEEQQALMLRPLLADRFKLQITRSTKEGNVLALVVAKGGPKLKEVPPPDPHGGPMPSSPPPERGGAPPTPPPGGSMMMMNGSAGVATLSSNAIPISNLVNLLSMQVGQQVVDQTGLKGTYQFTLQFAPQMGLGGMPPPPGAEAPSNSDEPSIFTALQEQLGLKLESTKGPIDTITIDHIEEPSEN